MGMLRGTKSPGHPKFSNTKHDEAAYYSACQTHRSIRLFDRACVGENPETAWTVFLCYDTDEHNSDITKFHEGDWAMLRESISPAAQKVVGLAAEADIEDVMLCDLPGVLSFCVLSTVSEQNVHRFLRSSRN